MGIRVAAADRLDGAERAAVRGLAAAFETRDGQPPLSDQALTHLGSADVRHLMARDGVRLAGYAQLDGGAVELLAEPAALDALLRAAEDAAPDGTLVWSHGQRSPLAAALEARGYSRTRVLHQLRRPAAVAPLLAPAADGVTIRAFVPGADEDAWLRVNAAAFATHPEQGRWTRADLEAREAEPWFDPAGFFLAQRDGGVLGFHWTKVHDDGAGEVYVLGVDPAAQGLGLGATLLAQGLAYLAGRGCRYVLLYVDESNSTAMRLYAKAGFESYDADVQWRRATASER